MFVIPFSKFLTTFKWNLKEFLQQTVAWLDESRVSQFLCLSLDGTWDLIDSWAIDGIILSVQFPAFYRATLLADSLSCPYLAHFYAILNQI